MCGIVGITGKSEAASRLLDGLIRLEYRGYDSAGIAIANGGGIDRRRAPGRLQSLASLLTEEPLHGNTGIAHTRWATHGQPNETNAHPHMSGGVAIVHNGIIENFKELRDELQAAGARFETETDSEVIAQLLNHYIDGGKAPVDAFELMLGRLSGAFAIAAVFQSDQGLMIGARQGSPLVLGYGEGEMYLGSDAIALAPLTRDVCYLEEGDWVVTYPDRAIIRNRAGEIVDRPRVRSSVNPAMVELGNFQHFMRKEIFEQPEAIARSIAPYINAGEQTVKLDPAILETFANADRSVSVACGTAYYAGAVAKHWFEKLAGLAVEVDIASEFRYRDPVLPNTGPAMFVSQSGETADTLAALRHCNANGTPTLALVNVPESSIEREATHVLRTYAGPEIGVASTKAFTAQLASLAAISIGAARARGRIDEATERELVRQLIAIPRQVTEAIKLEDHIATISEDISEATSILFLGRDINHPLAMEGALKLKEVSYIHAEGYAAGELKHGPIALIEDDVPVVVVAPFDKLFEKTLSNIAAVHSRGAKVVLISDKRGIEATGDLAAHTIELPQIDGFASAFSASVAVQLLAYHVALAKGTDVDKPRNLAKSVTVE
ncbi:MAG: glutamine--fructose-6-phosphate transaminase (isomerizing) [Pseudomonadota bacterium]